VAAPDESAASESRRSDPTRTIHPRWRDVRRLIPHVPEVHDESYWPAYVAMAAAIGLHIRLPSAFDLGPGWILTALESALLVALLLGRYVSPRRRRVSTLAVLRQLTIIMIALVTADNVVSIALLIRGLLRGDLQTNGRTLVLSAIAIWLTNVIAFALWYWELDGGGPIPRRIDPEGHRDFLYPQMQLQQDEQEQLLRDQRDESEGRTTNRKEPKYIGWMPTFLDYFYVSFTNSTAFSPTDTMPLTTLAKLLMMVQSAAALLTVALIAARAVNILN
jgi:hypothetical protein